MAQVLMMDWKKYQKHILFYQEIICFFNFHFLRETWPRGFGMVAKMAHINAKDRTQQQKLKPNNKSWQHKDKSQTKSTKGIARLILLWLLMSSFGFCCCWLVYFVMVWAGIIGRELVNPLGSMKVWKWPLSRGASVWSYVHLCIKCRPRQ